MRVVLCNWIDKLLSYAQEKALSTGKEAMYERLKGAGRESIFYCDMDDHWQQKPPHFLVSDGILCAKDFDMMLRMNPSLRYVSKSERDKIIAAIAEHQRYFQAFNTDSSRNYRWDQEQVDAGYEYVVSGAARATQNRLAVVSKWYQITEEDDLFKSDNNHFFCSTTAAETFLNKALRRWNSFQFYQGFRSNIDPSLLNYDPLFQQKNHLMAAQLMRYINNGHDHSWHS